MKKQTGWSLAILASSAAGIIALQSLAGASVSEGLPDGLPAASGIATIASHIPTASPTFEGCAFMWAYHDDPVLTRKIDEMVRGLAPAASADARQFGEDCVYADGHASFTAMQTDFHIRLPIDEASSEEALGNLILQVMENILALPEGQVPGGRGFVEFTFIESDLDQTVLRVDVEIYSGLAPRDSGEALFRYFHTPAPPPETLHPPTPIPTSPP
jgi:hypothetical protein